MKKILLSLTVLAALAACTKTETAQTPDASKAASAPVVPASAAQPVAATYDPNLKPVNIQWKDEATKKRFEEAAAKAAANRQAAASQPARK